MNLQHMKYAIVIAQTQSINKAAEKLYVGQPTLSRAIKELEASLGITLFERSTKGMTLTADGELFIRCAKNVLAQVEDIEKLFGREGAVRRRFSLSAPRAGYVYEAFMRFSREIDPNMRSELVYRETDALNAIQDVEQGKSALGVIRYAAHSDSYYKELLEEKELNCELVAEFRMGLLMGENNPLATREQLTAEDLAEGMELILADSRAPATPGGENRREEREPLARRQVYLRGGNALELLSRNEQAHLWSAPVPEQQRRLYGLVFREVPWRAEIYRDMLIRRSDYVQTKLDGLFTEQLIRARRETIG